MSENSNDERIQALRDLLELRRPVGEAVSRLRRFPWDSANELVILTRRSALDMVNRYLGDQLTASEFVEWANALEGRDDVGFEDLDEDLLRQFLLEFANPELFEPISTDLAREWSVRLR